MCALTITSCGSTTAESEVSSEPTTSVSDTTAASEPEFDVPEVNDYDGYEFRMIINENRNADSSKLYAAEENGEVINDAVFDRNRAVSENYNITIVGLSDKNNTVDETLKTSVLAGEDLCDFAAVPARKHFPLAQENVLIELNALDCIDFSMPWWDESILEAFQVNGKNYTVTGDISTEDDIYALIMLFNKKLYGDLGFEDPYTLVSDGRWVYDTFYKMAKSGSSDLNGDGKMDQSDRWGFITENEAWYYYSTGADMMPLTRDADGSLRYTLNDEKTYNILEKTKQIFLDDKVSIIAENVTVTAGYNSVWAVVEAMFMNNQGLFNSGMFNDVTRFRNMEIDFGVLPMPKYDEAQDEYHNLVTHHFDSLVFPVTVSDTERTMNITDALAYESMLKLNPCFYEIFLDEKLVRDENSKAMIDIMLDTKVYDLEYTANITGLASIMYEITESRSDNFASQWASIKEAANAKLAVFEKTFED